MDALILVDLQRDFMPGGALAMPDGDAVVPVANRLSAHFEMVLATQNWHPPNHGGFATQHAGKRPGDVIEWNGLRQELWPVHCVQNSHGAALHPKLDVRPIARLFYKGADPGIDSYSAFFDNAHRKATGLGEYLARDGVHEVYLMGLATDYCVKFSGLGAIRVGLQTLVVRDGCRGINLHPGDIERAFDEMRKAGVTLVTSDALLTWPPVPAAPDERAARLAWQ